MTSYNVTASFTVQVTNPSALQGIAAISGGAGGDERSQIEAALQTGLKELTPVASRYGFAITDSEAHVEGA